MRVLGPKLSPRPALPPELWNDNLGPLLPKLWNDSSGWDAIAAKLWMGCPCCQKCGMALDGMPLMP
eukprot:6379005-Amphidinium_carterae.1